MSRVSGPRPDRRAGAWPEGRGRAPRRAPQATCAALAGVLVAVIAGSVAPAYGTGARPFLPRIPLDATLTTPTGTWADLAMGRLAERLNTFWELFDIPSGASRWSLVTPPGVADNGGLVSATAPHAGLLTGFEASVDLGFSPLAETTDAGRSWSPGLLPSELARVPDALAVSAGHRVLALLSTGSGRVLDASSGDLSRWHRVATERAVASSAAGRACGLLRLTAVATSASGGDALGAACGAPGRVGVLVGSATGWSLAAPRLRGSLSGAATEIVRLTASSGTLAALAAAVSAGRTWLVGAWPGSSAGSWGVSPELELAPGSELTSTAALAGGGFAVTVARGARVGVEVLAGAHARWSRLPEAPAGTVAIASTPGGRYDALTVDGSKFADYVLARGASSWRRAQRITAPIQYGSSG